MAGLNDQHAFVAVPLGVGDRMVLGISHPGIAVDKWQAAPSPMTAIA
ncbi:MAG: hypothetical protein JWM19_169 [Actinomycetia bacterium]|nr:hypothetical protein [Actinomycetes bacterium]